MGIDREAAVKKADDLAREGKLDLAIEEYLRLVEDQPGDFGAANALGDLYVKVGNKKQAVARFVQIGDSQRESGFIPKAVAFYKKALKIDPGSDHALAQLAQIACDQELYADATLYLNRLLQLRRELGDDAGVADCVVRLGGLPSANADAKMAAARAAAGHFTPVQAARLWIEAADALERGGRPREAVDVLFQAHSLDREDAALRRRIALACAGTGQVERATAILSLDVAGDHPDLLLAFAEKAIRDGRDDEARHALQKTIAVAPDRRVEAEAMLAPLVPPPPEPVPDVPAEDVEITLDGEIAVDEIAVDGEPAREPPTAPETLLGGFVLETTSQTADVPRFEAEPATADTTAETAGGPEAQPEASSSNDFQWSALLGEGDEDAAEPAPVEATASEHAVSSPAVDGAAEDDVFVLSVDDPLPEPEIDAPADTPAPAAEPEPAPVVDEGTVAALAAAAENPSLQFQASAQLGRLLLRAGRASEGIAWLERAAQATTSARDQRLDIMYELGDALERHGNAARALDVFADLDFDAASFRDVPERLVRLRRALEEGRST